MDFVFFSVIQLLLEIIWEEVIWQYILRLLSDYGETAELTRFYWVCS